MEDVVGKTVGRYKVSAKLGEGGMAVVYKAVDVLDREVALKLIRIDNFPAALLDEIFKRFEREARALAKFQHPNIVTILEYGEYEHTPFLVMEYLHGGTLRQQMGRPMKYVEAAAILKPIADALTYAHSKGIVHRDIKPENILFSEIGIPKVSDFGIARLLGMSETTQLTGTGMGIGTPAYMAPEQWNGQVTPLVDVHALGVVLYEMVTGSIPYQANNPPELYIMYWNQKL